MPMWTNDQLRAIETRGINLLVSAGAGSGKTAVLTRRIVELIREGASIEHILVVTFTRAAAAEMRDRVIHALEAEEGNARFAREALLAERAHIQTLHGFCTDLLREHFNALSLPAGFRVMDAAEARALTDEVLDEALDAYYERYGDAAHEADARLGGVDAFRDALLKLHDFLMGLPQPARWLEEALDMHDAAAGADGACPYARVLDARLSAMRDAARALINEALAMCLRPGGPAEYVAALSGDLEQLEAAFGEGVPPAFARLPSRTGAPPERKEAVKALREEAKDMIRQIAQRAGGGGAARAGVEAASPALRMLARAWGMFSQAFTARKRASGALDFADLEQCARDALCIDAIRDGVRARYKHVFVDEYQDTSALQEDIIERITSGGNLFAVGDVKQSIYRFRQADPSVFTARMEACRAGGGDALVRLGDNFRSRAGLLGAVNHIFGACMRRDACGVEYADGHALTAGREGAGAPVGVALLDAAPLEGAADDLPEEQRELTSIEMEAAYAARFIQRRVGHTMIDTGEGVRPVRYSDIVILLRAVKGRADIFARALDALGVPCMTDAAGAARLSPEVLSVLALLRAVDNARDDEAVICALTGAGFTAEDTARVRLVNRDAPLCECLRLCALEEGPLADKAAAFLGRLDVLRRRARHETPGMFVRYVTELLTQDGTVAALPGGEARKGGLELLCARAEAYDSTPGRTLYDFLADLGDALSPRDDLAPTQLLLSDNVVRVMSIHKSKGLEFPIVVIAGMGVKFNKRDAASRLLLDRRLGIGARCVDPDTGAIVPGVVYDALSLDSERQLLGEEMRILYVAMTRAREEAVLLGAVYGARRAAEGWARPLDEYALLSAACPFDFVMPTLMRHADGAALRALAGEGAGLELDAARLPIPSTMDMRHLEAPNLPSGAGSGGHDAVRNPGCAGTGSAPSTAYPGTFSRYDVAVYDRAGVRLEGGVRGERLGYGALLDAALEEPPSAEAAALLAYNYPCGAAAGRPLKLSVSDMVKDAAAAAEKPRFSGGRLSAVQRGNATHKVLSMLNFAPLAAAAARGALGEELARQADSFLSARRIDESTAQAADMAGIEGFFRSRVGLDALSARTVLREQPFNMMLPLSACEPGAPDVPFLVQGVIDLCYIKDGQWVLVDFKTDRVAEGGADAVVDRYRAQVALYRRALTAATKRAVSACYIALLSAGGVFPVDGAADYA